MASTYSPNLKLELIANGEQSGVWGSTTNTNIGTALEEAIVGRATVTFTTGDVTLTLANTNASQSGRAFAIRMEGSPAGPFNLIVPTVNKPYIVRNLTGQTITVKTAAGSGVALPNGGRFFVYCNGTDVVDVISYLPQLALPITGVLKGNGGTTAISAATANSDYLVPALANTAVSGFKTAVFHQQYTIATTSGAISVDWTVAQNQKQTEPTGSITYSFVAPPGPCHLQLLIDSDGTSTAQTFTWPASVIWMGMVWTAVANKKGVVNFWYDGTNYYAMGANQV
jgi:hypothetical protein